ncbi:roadblock/LC7 domain-containing protein [Streptomyces sp. NPDC005336]|uniref:roadblock/LC7 domain-containing protein n=1 Tax=Streptomyces sp. NPDC005336 TaxID=3157035 RepID=UPI0033B941E8
MNPHDLDWKLDSLLSRTPGARHALAVSNDGLVITCSADLARSEAETLAAIASGIQSLARTVSTKFGDGTGSVEHSLVAVGGSLLMTVEAGGAHLAVLAEEDADPGIIGNSMSALADGLDAYITSPQRAPGEGATRRHDALGRP